MKKRQVVKDVQIRVKKYLEYTLDNESSKLDEEHLMELLSDNLKKELIMEINGTILNRFYIFNYIGFTDKLIGKIACLMKEKIYGNEEIILKVICF